MKAWTFLPQISSELMTGRESVAQILHQTLSLTVRQNQYLHLQGVEVLVQEDVGNHFVNGSVQAVHS